MVLWVSSISGCGLCVSCLARVASLGVQSIYKSLPFSEGAQPGRVAPAIRPEARVISGHNTTRSRAVQTGSRHHAVQGNGLVRRRVQPQQPQQPQQALLAALFTEPPATLQYHQLITSSVAVIGIAIIITNISISRLALHLDRHCRGINLF